MKWRHTIIDWNKHVEMLHHTCGFKSRYHMTEPSFNKLVDLLRPQLIGDELQSIRSNSGNDPITPEMIVGSGLRFLGGEHHKSIADIFGMSLTSAVRVVNIFLHAVDSNKRLALKIPTTISELEKLADDWNALSSAFSLYDGTVGAIDGWLACIEKPAVDGAADYFSGHYQRYGLNIQAVCDSNLRFIYFGVNAPGRTNDARVFNRCKKLRQWLASIPNQYFLIGDNAYPLSNKLLIPFSGSQKHFTYNRSYNFYLSQLRIRIEMAFGRLTTKWRIFRRNLDYSLEKNAMICRVASILHNFVIDSDNLTFEASLDSNNMEEFGVESLLDGPNGNRGYFPSLPCRSSDANIVNSRRTNMLAEIKSRDLRRPVHNLIRNQELDDESVYEDDG